MKDSSAQIVLNSRWILVVLLFGWFFVVTGLVFVLFAIVATSMFLSGAEPIEGVILGDLSVAGIMAGTGIPVVLFGIWLAGLRTKVTSSLGSEYIRIARGQFPIFLPSLRNKRISREEARSAFVQSIHKSSSGYYMPNGTSSGSWSPGGEWTEYVIKIRLSSRKTLEIFNAGRKSRRADELVRRIREFAGDALKTDRMEYHEAVDFSTEKLLGIVSVIELRGGEVAERDLRFYSSGILSPEPIPYADISRIRVYKALGFLPRIEICTNFGTKNRFNLSLMGRVGGLRDRHKVLLKCCSVVNSACPDKLETKPKYLKDALALEPHKAETDLKSLTGKMASTSASRLALYRSGLSALIQARGGSYIFLECKERPECYVQFGWELDSPNLTGLVSGPPVSERGRDILLSRGFKLSEEFSDELGPDYSQDFKTPELSRLAGLAEEVFREALDCPDSYTVHVAEAVYRE